MIFNPPIDPGIYVKSVNGNVPDDDGNVEVETSSTTIVHDILLEYSSGLPNTLDISSYLDDVNLGTLFEESQTNNVLLRITVTNEESEENPTYVYVFKLENANKKDDEYITMYSVYFSLVDKQTNSVIVYCNTGSDEYDTNLTKSIVSELPPASSSDNGKFLRVVNGAAAWQTVPNAEDSTFGGD